MLDHFPGETHSHVSETFFPLRQGIAKFSILLDVISGGEGHSLNQTLDVDTPVLA
jgi:hypothetical protein